MLGRSRLSEKEELKRLESLKRFENQLYQEGYTYIAGIDEVGRGPLAGPVVAAAVILPPEFCLPGVNDSKVLSEKKRQSLASQIKRFALSWAIGIVSPVVIDRDNILNATCEAMRLAGKALLPKPDFLLIDAVKIPDIDINQLAIIKGDTLSMSIACASIIAKTERDQIMKAYDLLYPNYGFARHKGYATREHLLALEAYGPCPIHRHSFEPIKSMRESSYEFKQQQCLFE
ncbi:Ribonuclease HII [Syntrophomonas zehnderi OL-4]|uniref:Ribonuclease HII n=1 Tax=Syntrophomonas zehnderi OL-4 TaxID=690567 RepID=A0A0E4GC33_9FIRM|nr:Ribonuclease HII [Syntrophomonas zehnderi OL-4]